LPKSKPCVTTAIIFFAPASLQTQEAVSWRKQDIIVRRVQTIVCSELQIKKHTKNWDIILLSTGHFKEVYFQETDYHEEMSLERYLGVWKSVNDLRVQAGEANFSKIIQEIQAIIKDQKRIRVPYKIRSWTVRKV